MKGDRWPVLLALLFLALLAWYVLYTQRIVTALRADAEIFTELFNEVQDAQLDPDPASAETALFRLGEILLRTEVPTVLTGPGDTVYAAENLPFEADLTDPAGQERVREYVRRLDARRPPIGDPTTQHIHFGDTPELRSLVWIPWLQAGGLLMTVLVGLAVVSAQRRAESERAWTSMARELAHQLGTPISSLKGWMEVLRLLPEERPGALTEADIANALEEDLTRLERISHRFELIGREPELEPMDVGVLVEDLQRYLEARLPRLGRGVELRVEVARDVPTILGNEVLLAWALENVVKNALDALAGTGGRIELKAYPANQFVALRISDTGPGVDPEIRDRIFEPGVSTKSGGWGVGLALSRRIVEGVHGGRIELLESFGEGAIFMFYLPVAG